MWTLCWRGLDSNFQYASAMNLVVAPVSLGRVGAPFCQPILSGTQPKDTRSAIAVALSAADPSQANGRGKRPTTSFTTPAYWKFESSPLQQTVRLFPDFAFVPGKARVFRQCGEDA